MCAKRIETIGDATLYLGDCLEVMPGLPRVDHLITDPPYEAEAHKAARQTAKSIRTGQSAALDFSPVTEEQRNALPEFCADKVTGWSLMFCQSEGVAAWRDAVAAHGGKYRSALVWVKPDGAPKFSGDGPAVGYECAVTAWWGEGRSVWNAGGKRGVYTHNVNGRERYGGHPTEKPLSLMRELIADFTAPADVIADVFMGSGSTGVAALQMGRKFIGVELSETYFDIACRRIEEQWRQPALFAARAVELKQKLDDLFGEDT